MCSCMCVHPQSTSFYTQNTFVHTCAHTCVHTCVHTCRSEAPSPSSSATRPQWSTSSTCALSGWVKVWQWQRKGSGERWQAALACATLSLTCSPQTLKRRNSPLNVEATPGFRVLTNSPSERSLSPLCQAFSHSPPHLCPCPHGATASTP